MKLGKGWEKPPIATYLTYIISLDILMYFFPYSFRWVWNIHRTPYLFQLYIFVMTFLFKEFIKAQYLYTPLALFVSD